MNNLLENQNFILIVEAIAYIFSAFALFLAGKIIYGLSHKNIKINIELVKKDNLAFAISITGYYIGLLISILGVIVGDSNGLLIDLLDILIYGILAILLLNVSSFLCDKIILRKFNVTKEIIEDQNSGTGVVEAAVMIASGLVIYGAVSGETHNFFENIRSGYLLSGIISTISFWIVGQIVLIITSFIYDLLTPYNIHEHIEKDNVAVGVGFSGAIIALGILVKLGISGNFISWGHNLYWFSVDIMFGLALLPVVRFITDKLLLPGEKLTDEIVNQEKPNIGAAIIEAFAYIGGAVLISYCL
jgi:uncharacterized membrane protein YjfL (UPF0719 family)